MSRAGFAIVLRSLAVLATLAGRPAASAASLSSGSTSLDLGGSLRTIPALVQAPGSDPTRGAFLRVQAGPVGTRAAAVARCRAFQAAGLDCLVLPNAGLVPL